MDASQRMGGAGDRATQPEVEIAADADVATMDKCAARSSDLQETNEPDAHKNAPPPKRRGRPPVDVFRRPGARSSFFTLRQRRSICVGRLNTWTDVYNSQKFTRLVWRRMRHDGHPDWELYKASELAMAVMGRRAPERLDEKMDGKPWHRRNEHPFDKEAKLFIHWLRKELDQNRDHVRGPKPDFLKLWKTAVALAVARYVVTAIGKRHYRQPPTPREIAQIWYALFGEHEPREAIRDRLEPVARLCRQFARDGQYEMAGRKREYFRKASDCILKKSPRKSRRKQRGGGR